MDVGVILSAFCAFIVSGKLLKQLRAFQASYRNSKNRVATLQRVDLAQWLWQSEKW